MKERPVMPALDGKSILDMCCGSRMFWFDKQENGPYSTISAARATPCATAESSLSPLT